jgi:hypothetical protein
MATQAIPLHPQWRVNIQKLQIWGENSQLASFDGFSRLLVTFADFGEFSQLFNS